MRFIENIFSRFGNFDLGVLLLRLSVGIMMLLHGISKVLNGVGGIKGMLSKEGLPEFIAYGVYLGEVIAPIMIILGFYTRLGSFLLFSTMTVIIYLAHANDIFSMSKYGGLANESLIFYIFVSLALIFTGGGKYSLRK